jgi:STE24 endopeptidase
MDQIHLEGPANPETASQVTVAVDGERQRAAKEYARIRRVVWLVDLLFGAVVLTAFILTGANVALRDRVGEWTGLRLGQVAIYVVVVLLAFTVLSLPISVFSGWRLPQRYGLSTQSLGQWFIDWFKGLGVGLVLLLIMVEVLYALIQLLPNLWWLAAAVLYLFFAVGLANLGPVLLVPIFYKLTPLESSPLTERLEALARQAQARVRGVYRMNLSAKTTAANAALMGLGNTRRIVIGDTLLDRYSSSEIEAVFAHELGHHVHADVPRLVVGQAVVTLVGLFLCGVVLNWAVTATSLHGVGDIATLPLLALVLGAFGVLVEPLVNFVSRRMERAADQYALETTGNPGAFISAMTRLANQNLAELDPDRWIEVLFYDHPAIGRRIRHAEAFARDQRV